MQYIMVAYLEQLIGVSSDELNVREVNSVIYNLQCK